MSDSPTGRTGTDTNENNQHRSKRANDLDTSSPPLPPRPIGPPGLTDVERQHAVGRVGQRGLELQGRLLQPQDVGEDVLMEARDELQLRRRQREARLLQLDGDGDLPRARVHWEVGDLEGGGEVVWSV